MACHALRFCAIAIALLGAACTTFKGEDEGDAAASSSGTSGTNGTSGSSGTHEDPDAGGVDTGIPGVRCATQSDCRPGVSECCTLYDNRLKLQGTICTISGRCLPPERRICSSEADCSGKPCVPLPAPFTAVKACSPQ